MTGASDVRRVVVTGASSFLGAHIAAGFDDRGYEVTATLTRDAGEYDGVRRDRLLMLQRRGIRLERLDFLRLDEAAALMRALSPGLWVHHAGWAVNYAAPDYDLGQGLATNVAALDGIYSCLADAGCRGVIVTGSSAEYSDSGAADDESDPCLPETPYGLAKLAETLRARQLASRFAISTRVARVYIPFGTLDAPEKLMSAVVSALLKGVPVDLSPCTQQRDFIYVDDLVRGYLALADDLERRQGFDIFNLCSGLAVELRELLMTICDEIGVDSELLRFGARAMRPGEPQVSFGSPAKAERLLQWKSRELRASVRAFLRAAGVEVS